MVAHVRSASDGVEVVERGKALPLLVVHALELVSIEGG
jgi:hypothetical protein